MSDTIKALSILQPWAELIVSGQKFIETRSWQTKYRGPLLIHAGKNPEYLNDLSIRAMLADYNVSYRLYPLGALVGLVELQGCYPVSAYLSTLSRKERRFGNFSAGRYGWLLKPIKQFSPVIDYRGQQGLFNVPKSIMEGLL